MDSEGAGRHVRKERLGRVISNSMNKTIVVLSESRRADPRYGKVVRYVKKLYAHDEKDEAEVGDLVRVCETRPLSRMKRWRLVKVEARAPSSAQ